MNMTSLGQRCLVATAVAVVMACGVSGNCQRTRKPDVKERVDSLPGWNGAFRIFPIDKPIFDEDWANTASTPNAVYRFVFVSRGRGLSFFVTFVLGDFEPNAHAMWQRSAALSQMAGRISKEFGADELESWPSHLTGRWGPIVATVATDGTTATPKEWSSVMKVVDMALLGK